MATRGCHCHSNKNLEFLNKVSIFLRGVWERAHALGDVQFCSPIHFIAAVLAPRMHDYYHACIHTLISVSIPGHFPIAIMKLLPRISSSQLDQNIIIIDS